MWLDGVYMLPLILLGVYQAINKNKHGTFISAAALSIIFNWYTGAINLLFAAVFALVLLFYKKFFENQKFNFKLIFRLLFDTILAVCLSAFILLPTVAALSDGRGSVSWSALNLSLISDALNTIRSYYPGTSSSKTNLVLYLGSLPLLVFLNYFFSKNIPTHKKVYVFLFVLALVLLYYFTPFFFTFSLLKSATSYYCRYSYGMLAILLFTANTILNKYKFDFLDYLRSSTAFIILVLLVNTTISYPSSSRQLLYALGIVITIIISSLIKNSSRRNIFIKTLLYAEIILSTVLLLKTHITDNATYTSNYFTEQSAQINEIQNSDSSIYRISNTNRRTDASYNDNLAYNYMSISEYTSDPENTTLELYNKLGYNHMGENISITNASILSTDSLLGVKYILSKNYLSYLNTTNFSIANSKSVYENQYTLPLAFTTSTDLTKLEYSGNTFEYQNELYKTLSSIDENIYQELSITKTIDDKTIYYQINDLPSGCIPYMNLNYQKTLNAKVYQSNIFITEYAKWLSPSVIPLTGDDEIKIVLSSTYDDSMFGEEQFYCLNLDTFEKVTSAIKNSNSSTIGSLKNGEVSITVAKNHSDYLFVSIPYEKGWTITNNGETVEPVLFEDSHMIIPLSQGENKIEMHFVTPWESSGITISIIAFIVTILYLNYPKWKDSKEKTLTHN